MASVTLDSAFLAPASDLSDVLTFGTNGRSDKPSTPGEFRSYANGRRRLITTAGRDRQLDVTAVFLTLADAERLLAMSGQVVLFRDAWGRRVFGAFLGASVRDYTDRLHQDVTFTLTEVTYSEAV